MRVRVLAMVIALCLPQVSAAQSVDDARAMYRAGQHAEAVEIFQRFAAEGDANAQNALAIAYWNGEGVEIDLDEALRLLEASAAQGFPRAIYNLGIFWRDGDGAFDSDLGKAERHLREARDLGYTYAYSALGELYAEYIDPPKYAAAAAAFEAGLSSDDDWNASDLARLYTLGLGVPQDFARAAELYQIAYDNGSQYGASGLAFLAARGQGEAVDLDKAMRLVADYIQLSQDDGYATDHADVAETIRDEFLHDADGPFALRVLQEGVAAGETRAMIRLGAWTRDGVFTEEDLVGARALFRRAGEAGDGNGFFELAITYDETDPDEAAIAFGAIQKAYDMGSHAAISGLSYHFYYGYGVTQDVDKAHQFSLEGAALETANFYDYYNVGTDYLNGTGTEKDLAKAFDYLQRAYDTNTIGVEAYLGDFYRAGEVVSKDLDRALAYYEEGVQWGDTRSIWALGRAYELGEAVPQSYATAYLLYQQAFEEEEFEAARSLAAAAADWPNGTWASAEDAYRYCLTAASWNNEPFRDFTSKDCAAYKAILTEGQAARVESSVE